MKRLSLSLAATLMLSTTASADNGDVLLIGGVDQSVLQRLTGAGGLEEIEAAFSERGSEVRIVSDESAEDIRTGIGDFASSLDGATDHVIIALTGRFVSTAAGSYLIDPDWPAGPTLGDVLTRGIALDAIYAVASLYPGRGLVVLGETSGNDVTAEGLSAGLTLTDIPQGVTVVYGDAEDAAEFVQTVSEATGGDILDLARDAGLSAAGFVPRELPVFLNTDVSLPQVQPDAPEDTRAEADAAAWERAVAANTEAAYETYLAAFPEGVNAASARQRLTAIRAEPFFQEKEAEAALSLPRDDRREIQRDLSLLGYNTRGIDGIFGPGTRAAVTAWQNENGFSASGYLSRDQITRLDAQAERRAAELEEEARARQAELERQDRAFWAETGAQGDEAGYRAYLKRFPDGVFAEVAQERVDAIDAQRRAQAEEKDRAIWQQARQTDTEQAYRAYLAERPEGAFAEEARARIDFLTRSDEDRALQSRAQAQEAALGLNAAARRLAEARLESLGLKPGTVDGDFDEASRRAIRRYQDARNLPVSGYLDQATVVRLMADSILR